MSSIHPVHSTETQGAAWNPDERLSAVIGEIYDASLDTALWPAALEKGLLHTSEQRQLLFTRRMYSVILLMLIFIGGFDGTMPGLYVYNYYNPFLSRVLP